MLAKRYKKRAEIDAQSNGYNAGFEAGYNAALSDSIGCLRKWFSAPNKIAKSCEAEIREMKQ